MSEINIKDYLNLFENKIVLLGLVVLIILFFYFRESNGNYTWAIIFLVIVIIVIIFIFQWLDQKSKRDIEKNVAREIQDEDEKELLKKYISWSRDLKDLFEKFIVTGKVFVEIEEQKKRISIRTHMDRDSSKIKGQYSYLVSIRIENELKNIERLRRDGVIKKTISKSGEPYNFKLTLTSKGKKLLDSIKTIKVLSE